MNSNSGAKSFKLRSKRCSIPTFQGCCIGLQKELKARRRISQTTVRVTSHAVSQLECSGGASGGCTSIVARSERVTSLKSCSCSNPKCHADDRKRIHHVANEMNSVTASGVTLYDLEPNTNTTLKMGNTKKTKK